MRRATLVALVAAAAATFPASTAGSKSPAALRFRATLAASVAASLHYTATEIRPDGCRYETTATGAARISVVSAHPSVVALRRRTVRGRAVWRLEGVLRPLTVRLAFGGGRGERRASGCGSEDGTVVGLICDAAVLGRARGLASRIDASPFSVSLGAIAHRFFGTAVPACDPTGKPRASEEIGNIEAAVGAIQHARRLLDPRVPRVVARATLNVEVPLDGEGIEGAVVRRVSWTLTLVRVTRPGEGRRRT